MKLSGWGRYPVVECNLTTPGDEYALIQQLEQGPAIARGNGRGYGDCALSRGNTIQMRRFNHMLGFDETTGQLVAEAGVLLEDVVRLFLPRGWFPSVTPGTRFVTLGGMVAADVHGKNHHKHGSFGNFVDWLDVIDHSGRIQRCSRSKNTELFEWTIGGMGLTGVILRVAFRLMPVETGWVRQSSLPAGNLGEAIQLFEDNLDCTYSVAWIDCLSRGAALGRSIVMLGEHAKRDELSPKQARDPFALGKKPMANVPLDMPRFLLNRHGMRLFNTLYYRKNARPVEGALKSWSSYFYPLDAVLNWNRMYGRRGFMQFQCVIPQAQAQDGMQALLERISASGQGSFLAVLKRFGAQNSRFSFPMEGYTLALDFPYDAGNDALLSDLEQITQRAGGRIYLAKDSHIDRACFRETDPERIAAFQQMRSAGGNVSFTSEQSERLAL